MAIIACIIPFLIGVFFCWLAFLFFGREKYPTSTLFGVIAAFFFLCSLPWFQGFAKTWFVSNINSKLAALGDQIESVQKTTGEMHSQLSNHQKQIDDHQKELASVQAKIRNTQVEVSESQAEITNQYQRLFALQADVAAAQTNLDTQQKKIEDVEYLTKNLFANTTTETIRGGDTNRVCFLTTRGTAFFRLDGIPIPESAQVMAIEPGTGNMPILLNKLQILNVISLNFEGGWDSWKKKEFIVKYVKDTRETNSIHYIEMRTNELILDHSAHIPFP